MSKLFVIGLAEPYLENHKKQILSKCKHLFCTDRFTEILHQENVVTPQIHPITPLNKALTEAMRLLDEGDVAILASGDPLYFGVGKTLLQLFENQTNKIEFLPALSAVQRAAALFQTPWNNAKVVSLHGRNVDHLPTLLLQDDPIFVFTDSKNTPTYIAGQLVKYLEDLGDEKRLQDCRIQIAENIGLSGQNVFKGDLQSCIRRSFSPLNIVCLESQKKDQKDSPAFGLIEDNISHSRGLITKNEVRAATLHALQLPRKGVMWDIGAGSGSISIEAARLFPELTVYAVEHKEEEILNIKKNIIKFGCYNVVPIFGNAPDILQSLAVPDRIFIGGSGGNLREIISYATSIVAAKGKIVINGVIRKTIQAAPVFLTENGFSYTTATVHVQREGMDTKAEEFNPITIISGTR